MLSRRPLIALAATALVALTLGSIDAAPLKLMRDHGWVVDDRYGKKHANAESKEAVLKAVDVGEPLVFWSESEDRYYPIADQEAARLWIAKRVQILGNVQPDGTLKVGNWREAPLEDD